VIAVFLVGLITASLLQRFITGVVLF